MPANNDTSGADGMILAIVLGGLLAIILGILTECTNDKPTAPAETPASADTAGFEPAKGLAPLTDFPGRRHSH